MAEDKSVLDKSKLEELNARDFVLSTKDFTIIEAIIDNRVKEAVEQVFYKYFVELPKKAREMQNGTQGSQDQA
jgi:hypothetical protein